MKKITKIVGLDNKYGRKSRTGSNVSIGIDDMTAHDIQTYLMAVDNNEDPTGKVKKIELVIYEDGEELETIEGLRAENQEIKKLYESITQPISDAIEQLEEVTGNIEEDLSNNGQANINLESLDHLNYQYNQGWISEEYYDKTKKELLEPENEHLPPNQLDLKLYENDGKQELSRVGIEKPCECKTPAFVNGKCANCGGVETIPKSQKL